MMGSTVAGESVHRVYITNLTREKGTRLQKPVYGRGSAIDSVWTLTLPSQRVELGSRLSTNSNQAWLMMLLWPRSWSLMNT